MQKSLTGTTSPLNVTVSSLLPHAEMSYTRFWMSLTIGSVQPVIPKRAKSGLNWISVYGRSVHGVIVGGCTVLRLCSNVWAYWSFRLASTVVTLNIVENSAVADPPMPCKPPVMRFSSLKFVDVRGSNTSCTDHSLLPCGSSYFVCTMLIPSPSLRTVTIPVSRSTATSMRVTQRRNGCAAHAFFFFLASAALALTIVALSSLTRTRWSHALTMISSTSL